MRLFLLEIFQFLLCSYHYKWSFESNIYCQHYDLRERKEGINKLFIGRGSEKWLEKWDKLMKNGSEGRDVFRESRKRYRARENQSDCKIRYHALWEKWMEIIAR